MSKDLPSLAEMQAELAHSLITGVPFELPGGILPGGTLDPESALDVYRRGYVVRLTEQLGETYEAVWWMLGDERFFDVCRRFIDGSRSGSYNLSDYGEGFAEFLATLPEAEDFAVLPELARLEWRFQRLFHLAEHAHVDAATLAGLGDLSGVRFGIGAATELVDSPYAVGEIFSRRKQAPVAGEILHWQRPQCLLLYKLNGEIYCKEIDAATLAVIASLRAGNGVEEALAEGLAADDGFGAAQASAVFELLVHCGLIETVTVAPDQARA